MIENILNKELSKGFSEVSWRKEDDEELNLRLESSGPWWSDENPDQDEMNNNLQQKTQHKKAKDTKRNDARRKKAPEMQVTAITNQFNDLPNCLNDRYVAEISYYAIVLPL